MTSRHVWYSAICFAITVAAHPASAQIPEGTAGSEIFRLYCASCHGTSAKGDGPLASSMSKRPADLTQITVRNGGGEFPADQVAQIIDGRKPVKGHGGGEMPVWGDAFSRSADPTPLEEKIRRVVAYLRSVQMKP